jgi:hypothetical protein
LHSIKKYSRKEENPMRLHRNRKTTVEILFGLLTAALLFAPAPLAADTASESVSGTLPGYQTTVNRETEGELSEENLRQASLLASQVVLHLNAATNELEVQNSKAATGQIDKALTLVGVIREMLPVTIETTVVRDADGKEIYRHTERSQNDLVPIYQAMTAVEVVQPILDAKWDDAAVEGIRLADVDLIHTSILTDLSYIERRLKRAKVLIESPEEALKQLVAAQVHGMHLSRNKRDNPLVAAQRALRLAEKMAEDENYRAADANLLAARNQLTIYRGLIAESGHQEVKNLQKEIQDLEGELDEKSAGVIRGFWKRVTNWMSEQPGQTTATEEASAARTESDS